MTDLSKVEKVLTYTELSTNERFAIWDFVILHASIPKLRIGIQFDDVSYKTNVSVGELPNLPKIEFSEPKPVPLPCECRISVRDHS